MKLIRERENANNKSVNLTNKKSSIKMFCFVRTGCQRMRRPKNGRRLEDDLQKLLLSAKEIINLQNLDNQIIHLPGRKITVRGTM